MGTVKDVTGSYAIGFMLLSEFALFCLIVNILVLQGRARLLDPASDDGSTPPPLSHPVTGAMRQTEPQAHQ